MTEPNDLPVMGGCLCNAVSFRVRGALSPVVACHCGQCRRMSGHYAAAAWTLKDGVEIEGEVKWYRSSDRAQRGFCPACGSSLFWDGEDGRLWIHAGTLDKPTGLTLAEHVFTGSKGDYYTLADDLPKTE